MNIDEINKILEEFAITLAAAKFPYRSSTDIDVYGFPLTK